MEENIFENITSNATWSVEECMENGINITETFTNPDQIFLVDNDTYVNCLGHKPEFTNEKLVQVIVLSLIAIASYIGNIMTIVSIKKSQRTRRFSRSSCTSIYRLILHLSIADLIVTAFCLSGEAAWKYSVEWLIGNYGCKIIKFLQMFGLYLSTYVMVLIGLDRLFAVKHPMKNLSNSKHQKRLLIGAYAISAALSLPQLFVFHVLKGPFIEDFYQCVTYGIYTAAWQEYVYTCCTLLMMFIVPLGVLLWSYMQTFKAIAESEKSFKEEIADGGRRADLNRRRLIHRAKMKSLKLSIVIVITFIICWAPYYIMMLICIFVDTTDSVGETLQEYIFFFGMSNSVMNPLIYGAFQMMPDKRKNSQSFRDGSVMNYRSTITNTSMYRGSTRAIGDRNVRRAESAIEEETTLMEDKSKNLSPGDFKRQPATNGYSSVVSPTCRKVSIAVNGDHVNNGKANTNGDIAKL